MKRDTGQFVTGYHGHVQIALRILACILGRFRVPERTPAMA